jgi:hypothetical protein
VANLPEVALVLWSYPPGTSFYVPGDPCQVDSTRPDSPATTAAELAAALAAQASRDASEPVDVTVGGFSGKAITLRVPVDADFAECEGGEFVTYGTEVDPLGRTQQGPGQIDELHILDVNGSIVVLDAMYRPDTPSQLVDEVRGIAASTTFGPTAAPTTEPTPSAAGSLPEGPYAFYDGVYAGGPPITVTIPAPGWDTESGTIATLQKHSNPDPPDGAGLIMFVGDLYVYADPCHWSTTRPDTPATTVDEVVAALAAQPSRDASEPVDITVDGYSGKSITLLVPGDAVFSECDQGEFASWTGGWPDPITSPSRPHQGPGQIDELWILDADGELVVIDATYGPDTPAEHLDELHAILESMTFEQ